MIHVLGIFGKTKTVEGNIGPFPGKDNVYIMPVESGAQGYIRAVNITVCWHLIEGSGKVGG